MLIFGLWHKGTLLLALWGTYQGLLLVLHRQWQQLTRSLGWDFSGSIPNLISWFITTASICLGWILFRSDSLPQALQMFRSLIDISSYSTVTLPHSFFFFVVVVILGYLGIVNMERLIADRSQDVRFPLEVRLALYSIAIYVGVLHTAQTQAFAYFQF